MIFVLCFLGVVRLWLVDLVPEHREHASSEPYFGSTSRESFRLPDSPL